MRMLPRLNAYRQVKLSLLPQYSQKLDLLHGLERASPLVVVKVVDLDVFWTRKVVVRSKDGGRWADEIHQGCGEEGASLVARGEVDTIEICSSSSGRSKRIFAAFLN